jgi:tetratricopeptide (TPR) repeat protein
MSDLGPSHVPLDRWRTVVAFAGVAAAIAAARSAGPGSIQAVLALLLLGGVPAATLALGGRSGRVLLLFAAVGAWSSLRPETLDAYSVPVLLLNRLGYLVVPPLILDLALGERGWARLKLEPIHVYGPAVVLGLGVLAHLVLRWGQGAQAEEPGIRWAAGIYSGCYFVLLLVALLVRVGSRPEKLKAAPTQRAAELEESGRFGLASRVYEREGHIEKSARIAERAGEWQRAAQLYRRAGDDFQAAEMYYRASMLEDALDSYERAGALAAAAGVSARLGRVERAMELYAQAGDRVAAIRVLEEAGGRATAEQLRQAGLFERARETYESAGDWLRAAEVSEHDLRDLPRAASLYVKGGSFLQAGRILESLGRLQEALEAYAAVPAGALEAARLYLSRGATREAADLLARLPASELGKLEDETTLLLVARVMLETPDDMRAAYLLECVLEQTRRTGEALRVFHGILQKDVAYADVQERYRRLKAVASGPEGAAQPE